ncbi:hypothetical protein [Neorhizobium galegae]|nr:hypothetical protein [Neorhizobium galegae]
MPAGRRFYEAAHSLHRSFVNLRSRTFRIASELDEIVGLDTSDR